LRSLSLRELALVQDAALDYFFMLLAVMARNIGDTGEIFEGRMIVGVRRGQILGEKVLDVDIYVATAVGC
jgi:hypothetical protein